MKNLKTNFRRKEELNDLEDRRRSTKLKPSGKKENKYRNNFVFEEDEDLDEDFYLPDNYNEDDEGYED
jgi:hypothetical protein